MPNIIKKIASLPGLVLGQAIRRERDFYAVRPSVATLYLTFRCNSRCATCTFWTRDARAETPRELDLDQWLRIAARLAESGIRTVEIFGGNVLLRKNVLIPLILKLKQLGMSVHLPTNQIGLDRKTIEQLVQSGLDVVYLSTDGVDEQQNAIRGFKGASDLNRKIITAFRQVRKTLGKDAPNLVCHTTVSRLNADELERIPPYAAEMGFDTLHIEYAGEMDDEVVARSIIDGLKPTPMFIRQNGQSILLDREQARHVKKKLRRIRGGNVDGMPHLRTINIDVLSEKRMVEGTIPHGKCYVERTEVTVDPYGQMVACPFIHNYAYGSLLEVDFHTLWNNRRHRRFRELQNQGMLPMCNHCILGAQRNPAFTLSLWRNALEYIVYPAMRCWRRLMKKLHTTDPQPGVESTTVLREAPKKSNVKWIGQTAVPQ